MPVCWLNGSLVAADKAAVSVFDHGLLYGDGVFEGIRFYNRQLLLVHEHLQRLFDSASALHITVPISEIGLIKAMQECIEVFEQADGYIRLLITRGVGALGVDTASCGRPTVLIIADRLHVLDETKRAQGLRALIATTRKVPNSCWDSRIKSLNYLTQVKARMEATSAGMDEAIMLNQQGLVAEGAINNIFVVRAGELLTPPAIDGALAGITRGLVLKLALALGISARETSLTPFDLYTAEECFLTGTGIELAPVREIDGHRMRVCPGPIFSALHKLFTQRCFNKEAA